MRTLLTWDLTEAERRLVQAEWPPAVRLLGRESWQGQRRCSELSDVEVVVGFMRSVRDSPLDAMPRLRLVQLLGHGADELLSDDTVDRFRRRGIRVACARTAAVPIAEWVITAMNLLTRRMLPMHQALVTNGDWSHGRRQQSPEGVLGGELANSTVGIIGYGSIGVELHHRCRAFGMSVGALSRRPGRLADAGLDFVRGWHDLPDFLGACDHVVLTVPLDSSTRGLLGERELAAMRAGSFLVNVGRGALVDEEALWHALRSGHLGGAALDVFESESAHGAGYPTARPLHQFNTVLTPHCSGLTAQARARALRVAGENLRLLADDRALWHEIDLGRGRPSPGDDQDDLLINRTRKWFWTE